LKINQLATLCYTYLIFSYPVPLPEGDADEALLVRGGGLGALGLRHLSRVHDAQGPIKKHILCLSTGLVIFFHKYSLHHFLNF
jgi:hypothetical protein